MNQEKFKTADAILNPPSTPRKTDVSFKVDSPINLRKGTTEYYKYKYEVSKGQPNAAKNATFI